MLAGPTLRRCLFVLLLLVAAAPPGETAALATPHPLATQAGKEVLDRGGNAFDAAVAVAAALAVVEPYSCGLGGGGFFLLHRARDGRQWVLDARETAPGRAHPALYLDRQGTPHPRASMDGALAAAIPGLPAALAQLARSEGRLPLATTLAPAIRLAEGGVPVNARYRAMAQLRLAALRADAAAAGIFLHDGAVPPEGHVLRQPQLAQTLRRLAAQGHDGFYRGAVGRELVRAVRAGGGIWTRADLARYRVIERTPIVSTYRGLRVVSVPPPSAGGVTLAQSLGMLAHFDLDRLGPVERMHVVVEVLRRAYHDRARHLGDPAFVDIPLGRLLDPAYLAARARGIELSEATPSSTLEAAPAPRQGRHTAHFSIVDHAGNRVAATLSINLPFGAGVVAGTTGVLLNNEMDDFALQPGAANFYGLVGSHANRIEPHKRPLSSMTPTFVEDGRGVLVLGTPGGSRIISMVLLAILDYASQPAVDLPSLLAAPRYHHQYLPDRIEVEPEGFPDAWLDALQLKGHLVQPAAQRWGNMQMVWVDASGERAVAASDPRGQGSGLAWY